MKKSNPIVIKSSIFPKTFSSLLKFFSKSNFKNNNKVKEISNLLDSLLLSILGNADKLARIGNRNKLTFYDLINSINQNSVFSIKLSYPINHRVFQKNKKILLNTHKHFFYPNEIFKEINRKFLSPHVFQNWYINPPQKKVCPMEKNFGLLNFISFNEAIFLGYIFKIIFNGKNFERGLCLTLISDNFEFKNIYHYIFFWIANLFSKCTNKKKILTVLRIIYAITLNTTLFNYHIYKKILSTLINLLFTQDFRNEGGKTKKITIYSYGIVKRMESFFFKASDFFFIQIKWTFLKWLFESNRNEITGLKKISALYNFSKFINELFLEPFFKKFVKKKKSNNIC